jgi:hypothetical protein
LSNPEEPSVDILYATLITLGRGLQHSQLGSGTEGWPICRDDDAPNLGIGFGRSKGID